MLFFFQLISCDDLSGSTIIGVMFPHYMLITGRYLRVTKHGY